MSDEAAEKKERDEVAVAEGARARALREAKGLTQAALAAHMKVARATVAKIENGHLRLGKSSRIALADALGMQLSELETKLSSETRASPDYEALAARSEASPPETNESEIMLYYIDLAYRENRTLRFPDLEYAMDAAKSIDWKEFSGFIQDPQIVEAVAGQLVTAARDAKVAGASGELALAALALESLFALQTRYAAIISGMTDEEYRVARRGEIIETYKREHSIEIRWIERAVKYAGRDALAKHLGIERHTVPYLTMDQPYHAAHVLWARRIMLNKRREIARLLNDEFVMSLAPPLAEGEKRAEIEPLHEDDDIPF